MRTALLLIILGGGMNGSFTVPMKRVRGWDWEHIWLVWSLLAMVVIPLAIAMFSVPNLRMVYVDAGGGALVRTWFFGMLWGASAILFGLGVSRIGVALGFGIILGIASSLGALIPLIELHRDRISTTVGLLTLAGTGIVLLGVAGCTRAGVLREGAVRHHSAVGSFAGGAIICVLSGLGTTFMSVALNDATPIYKTAESLGTRPVNSISAVWPILLGGGFLVNASYCAFIVIRRHSVRHFLENTTTNLGFALLMAILWAGSNLSYGVGARGMGPLGLVVGWPIFMAVIVLTANAWGVWTGEWRGASLRAVKWAGLGNLLLVFGIVVIASGGRTF